MKTVVILIPVYELTFDKKKRYAIRRALDILKKYEIRFICSERYNESSLDFIPFSYYRFDRFERKFFDSVEGYNRLMRSLEFYNRYLDFEYMLIVQPDVLILEDKLEYWIEKGFSYVGAPFFKGFSSPTGGLIGGGNGGVSLRKVSQFADILKKVRYIPNKLVDVGWSWKRHLFAIFFERWLFSWNRRFLFPKVAEDIFWSLLVPSADKSFTVPPPEIAIKFAFEVQPERCYEISHGMLPFAAHAWYRYNPDFWYEKLDIDLSEGHE